MYSTIGYLIFETIRRSYIFSTGSGWTSSVDGAFLIKTSVAHSREMAVCGILRKNEQQVPSHKKISNERYKNVFIDEYAM